MVALQRRDAGAGRLDQPLDHLGGDAVAVERRLQRRLVAARHGAEPVALADAVVERGVGVEALLEGLVERGEDRGAVALHAVGGEQRAVLAVADGDLAAVGEAHGGVADVGRRQRRVGLVGEVGEAAGEGEHALALLAEHVLLAAVEVFELEAVEGEAAGAVGLNRIRVHPLVDGGERHLQQLGLEPRARLLPAREEHLHALALGVDGVVALVLVVAERRVVPDAVGELAELVLQAQHGEQRGGALRQRALQARQAVDELAQLVAGLLPLLPAGEDRPQVPAVAGVDLVAHVRARRRLGVDGGRRGGGAVNVGRSVHQRSSAAGDLSPRALQPRRQRSRAANRLARAAAEARRPATPSPSRVCGRAARATPRRRRRGR